MSRTGGVSQAARARATERATVRTKLGWASLARSSGRQLSEGRRDKPAMRIHSSEVTGPSSVSAGDESARATQDGGAQQACELLNALREYDRFRSEDTESLRAAIEDFQATADLPETGQPDAATLAALRREVERVQSARAETCAAVDQALTTFDAHAPRVERSSERLALAADRALAHPVLLDLHASVNRSRMDIPAARRRPSGREVDGWVAVSQGRARRIGLNARGELLVRTSLRHLAGSERVRTTVARALDTAEERYGRVDPAMVLAVAARESRGRAFEDHGGRVNMFHGGGIDFLDELMKDRTLFTAREVRGWRLVGANQTSNEHNRKVIPVEIPHRQQLLAYAGAVEKAQRNFEEALRSQFGEDRAQQLFARLDPDSRRMWLSLAFTAPNGRSYEGSDVEYGKWFGMRTVLGRIVERSHGDVDLSSILEPDPFLDQFHHFRRARVSAAEAHLFDVALDADELGGDR